MDGIYTDRSVLSTARILCGARGLRQAARVAQTHSDSIAATHPETSLHLAEVARFCERTFVAADMAQHRPVAA